MFITEKGLNPLLKSALIFRMENLLITMIYIKTISLLEHVVFRIRHLL
jgi:hypothetical protein